MKHTQFFFACITLLAANVKKTSQSIDVVSMDDYYSGKRINLREPFYRSSSSRILKSHNEESIGYRRDTTKTLLFVAPTGYGLFAALKVLDLRPMEQDILSVSLGRATFKYSNSFPYQNRRYFPNENTYTHYSPDGQINVTFVTGSFIPFTYDYEGFELIFTVQANYTKCSTFTFYCDNGRCISDSLKCDGHNHCGDRSDQKYCSHTINNPTSSRVAWIAGGVFFAIIGLACAIYIMIRKVSRSSTTETVITHPPPTQISSYPPYPQTGTGYPPPPPYPQNGVGYPAPPPPYGVSNPGYQ